MNTIADNSSIDKLSQTITRLNPYLVGLDYDMINDVKRNKFYDQLISSIVKDKTCADIGFGSGLLTMMALHHGAQHVFAYEADASTFDFGKALVERMGYADKVTFINEKWNGFLSKKEKKVDIFIHELFMRSVWGEGLKEIGNKVFEAPGQIFPHIIHCKVMCTSGFVSPEKYARYSNTKIPKIETEIDYLQDMNKHTHDLLGSQNYHAFYPNMHNPEVYQVIEDTFDNMCGSYTIDINKQIIPDIIETKVVVPDESYITTMCYANDHRITGNGHWPPDKIVYNDVGGEKIFKHRTSDGNWWLS